MSDQSKIIETELSPNLLALVRFYEGETSLKCELAAKTEFISAQRSAIMRFCEAVEGRARQLCPYTKQPNYLYRTAMEQLCDELAAKDEV